MRMFDAQDALTAKLKTALGGLADKWTADFGLPARRDSRHAWVDENVDDWQRDPETSGFPELDESFVLNVYFRAVKSGATADQVRAGILAAASAFEDAITADPTLAGTVSQATVDGGQYEGAFEDDRATKRVGVLHMKVGCRRW